MKKIDVPINNFWYKLLALVLALLLWFHVMQTQNNIADQSLTVPLEYRNLPASLVVLNEPAQVRVRIQGNGSGSSLSAKDVQAYVNLSGITAGKTEVSVRVLAPNSFDVVSVSPGQVLLDVEPEESKSFPVEVNTEFATPLPEGKQALAPIVAPGEVLVFGGKTKLETISRVAVTANIANPSESYRGAVPVQIFDKSGRVINEYFRLNPSVVEVSIPIVDAVPSKQVAVTVPTTGSVAEGYHIGKIAVNPEVVTISGSPGVLEKISAIHTTAVSVEGASSNLSQRQTLVLPDGVSVKGVTDVGVTVEITRQSQNETRSLSGLTVTSIHVGEGLTAKITPEKISITVQGAKERLASLTAEQITVQTDLTGLAAGSHQAAIKVQLPDGVQLTEQSDTMATVELKAAE